MHSATDGVERLFRRKREFRRLTRALVISVADGSTLLPSDIETFRQLPVVRLQPTLEDRQLCNLFHSSRARFRAAAELPPARAAAPPPALKDRF
jgi:hypothetical protein